MLQRENKRRDAEPVDETYADVYIEVVLPDGTRTERKVDKVRSLSSFVLCGGLWAWDADASDACRNTLT